MDNSIHLGIVGAGGRGMAFRIPALEDDRVDVQAVCDVSQEGLERATEAFDALEGYTDYHEMLWQSSIDAVLIATPKEYHVPQSVAALERDLDVLCEVPAARSAEECKELVRAVDQSEGTYMLAENDVFRREWMLIAELVKNGQFGDVYYARGERVTDDKNKLQSTPWRRTWRSGRNGITYPTHVLGPLLQWLPDDRIDRVACEGSGHHYMTPEGDNYDQEDSVIMLAKTEQGRLIVQRQDILSERPSVPYRFELQGTEGCFESDTTGGTNHRVQLGNTEGWRPLTDYEDDFLPEQWNKLPDIAGETGRNGGDYLLFKHFIDSIVNGTEPLLGVHEGLDMTLPGLLSERSIEHDGEWVSVPDSRDW